MKIILKIQIEFNNVIKGTVAEEKLIYVTDRIRETIKEFHSDSKVTLKSYSTEEPEGD